jgi:hypothetical protein
LTVSPRSQSWDPFDAVNGLAGFSATTIAQPRRVGSTEFWDSTGSKLLWQAFVTTGLPLRIESNEILRSLLFGSDAILGGRDADSEDNLLDDVQDLYAFFSAREEDPPPANIISEIEALATSRADRLATLLADIVAVIEESGEPEPPELFAPTLLRLSLLGAP